MKALLFSITAFLLLSTTSIAQTKTIFTKSFPTEKTTLFSLSATKLPMFIEQSDDNQIHVDFQIEFANYSEKEIKKILEGISVSTHVGLGIIDIIIESHTKLSRTHYMLNTKDALVFSFDDMQIQMNSKQLYKSKEELLKEIKLRRDMKSTLLDNLKVKDDQGKEKGLDLTTVQTMKTQLKVKVPKQIYFRIKAVESQVFVEDDLNQKFNIDLFKGMFKAKKLEHKESILSALDTNLEAERIAINQLLLKDVSKALLGSVEETKCRFNSSRVELGSVGKNNEIDDYDSKIYLYNFEENFEKLALKGDYTELYIFDFEGKVGMKAEGDITYMVRKKESNEIHTTMKVAVIEKQVEEDVYGRVTANLKKGILHVISHKDK